MVLPIISGAVSTISSIGSIVRGVQQKNEANRRDRNNIRPTYNISEQVYNNLDLAEYRAQQGYDQQTLNYLNNQQERGMQSSVSAILQGGGSVNGIGGIYDQFNQASRAIALEDEKNHMQNIKQLKDARETLAEEQARAWTINNFAPYKDEQLAINALRADGNRNISTGINNFSQIGMSIGKAFSAPKIPNNKDTYDLENNNTYFNNNEPIYNNDTNWGENDYQDFGGADSPIKFA